MLLPAFAVNAIIMMAAALGGWLANVQPPQALAHIAFAIGILPLILAAIGYFVPVLTRSAAAPSVLRAAPTAAGCGGLCIVAGFSGALDLGTASLLGATLAATAAIALLLWTRRQARRAIGAPHPGLGWYQAALACLILALLAVPAMTLWPASRPALRLFHLHLNLLGFIGLTALGTLQVLLPTAAGAANPDAARRLASDFRWAFGGALLTALGAVFAKPLAVAGALLYLVAPLRMLHAWRRRFPAALYERRGTAGSLVLAAIGLAALVCAGIAHATGILDAGSTMAGFVCAFLLPLVSGALAQLLPVWLRPGPQGDWHTHLRTALGRLGGIRALLMLSGGLIVACGERIGLWLAAAGAALLVIVLLAAIPAALSKPGNLRN